MAKKRPRWYVEEWIEHLGLTQERVAAEMGTSKGYLSEILTGKRRYNESTLKSLADVLGRAEWELLGVNPLDPTPVRDQLGRVWDNLSDEQQSTFLDLGEAMVRRNQLPKP